MITLWKLVSTGLPLSLTSILLASQPVVEQEEIGRQISFRNKAILRHIPAGSVFGITLGMFRIALYFCVKLCQDKPLFSIRFLRPKRPAPRGHQKNVWIFLTCSFYKISFTSSVLLFAFQPPFPNRQPQNFYLFSSLP
jgi:hypothetical protein